MSREDRAGDERDGRETLTIYPLRSTPVSLEEQDCIQALALHLRFRSLFLAPGGDR